MSEMVMVRRPRAATNEKYGNSGSYESVEHLLERLAGKCYARVKKLGLPMSYEDVMGEMNLSYVKALNAWKPEAGALFSTYCTTACLNNFNNAIAKMERDRVELGLIPFSHFERQDDERSPEEYLDGMATGVQDSPEYRIEAAQELEFNLSRLTTNARAVVAQLLRDKREGGTAMPRTLAQIFSQLQMTAAESRRVKIELSNTLGVRW